MVEATALRPATEAEALEMIRRSGPIAGVVAFSKLVGWERTRAQRFLDRCEQDGVVVLTRSLGGRTSIETVRSPGTHPALLPPGVPATTKPLLLPPAQGPAQVAQPWGAGISRGAAVVLLILIGVTLSAVGMFETATYAQASGGWSSLAKALGADTLTLTMPAAIGALWCRRSPVVVLALALWVAGLTITSANIAGFIGEHAEQYQAGREVAATDRNLVLERLARLREERRAITELRPVGAITAAINDARRSQVPSLREALAIAKRRDAVDAEISGIEKRLADLPRVATADASAAVLSLLTGATISEVELRRLRLAAMLLLPLCGGLVVAIAGALMPTRPSTT
jgi:hypothetical protein